MGFKNKISGLGYVILNVMRGLNVIALLAVIAASIVMLIKTFIINGFFFFDTIGHVITAFLAIFLIVSEVPFFQAVKSYYAVNWPLLSDKSGFITLGVLMMFDGISVLGNLNSDDTNPDRFGSSFYQVVVAGGVLCFTIGILNIPTSFLFQDRKVGVTARMVRQHGAVAAQRVANDIQFQMKRSPSNTPSVRTVMTDRRSVSAPIEAGLPLYNPPVLNRSNTISSSRYSVSTHGGLNISHPKVAADIREPDLAAHPALHSQRNNYI
jgi:hypothetical protein